MKKFVKILSLVVAPFVVMCAFLTGCKSCKGEKVNIENGDILQDMDVAPTQKAYYEEQTKQALAEYKSVASQHIVDGDEDRENPEVIAAANKAAAKLFAFACYNERTLDKYVYFSNQEGTTDLGTTGSATAVRQEYYLRINESAETCGYRYHSTLKKVTDSSGAVDMAKKAFESARLRVTDKSNLLYRFEGDKIKWDDYVERLDCSLLKSNWRTGEDWGREDLYIAKSSELPTIEDIENDIVSQAGNDNITIRCNINILADNIVKCANIIEDEDSGDIVVLMRIDDEVANADEASVKMLSKANGTKGDCNWQSNHVEGEEGIAEDTGLMIIFRLWSNGLFRSYQVIERWRGKMDIPVISVSGTANSVTYVYYSYSDRDCDMTEHLEMLEEAKAKVEG